MTVLDHSKQYLKAMEDGRTGRAAYWLARMQHDAPVRHMFHLPTNDGSRSLCGSQPEGDLIRMVATNVNCKGCLDILNEPCCKPYPPAKHTAVCPTVVHAPHALADDDSGLTQCGTLGPIGNQLPIGPYPNCERCLPAHMRLPQDR